MSSMPTDPRDRKLAEADGVAGNTGAVLAVEAASASSDTGDFGKTPFSSSYQWQAGDSGGDFSWSYDLEAPPSAGGHDPEVSLSYSSGAVDGQTAGANVQPGWIGEGWDYTPGYIERSYRPCADDTANSPAYTNATGDQCWRLPNARLVWNGKSTELILGADGKWRAADDDAAKVDLLTGTSNGDDNGEYWRITTTDGTRFYFGRNEMFDWTTGGRVMNSTSTVPVFA
ncbi:MAG: RHS repeat-associated core domain-containing protein, partial [Micromonosporaceae bacterium]